jgi:anti-sigma factor RsiW
MQGPALSCAECEEHIADLLDGTLSAGPKAQVEAHLAACGVCAELAQDAGAAMALTGRASAVEVPPTLVPQILAEMTVGPSRVLVQASLAERIFGRWIRPALQPRFALGLAMAALSVAVVSVHAPAPDKILYVPAPNKIWTTAENRVYRTFDRAVKDYDDLALVANVQNQIDDWRNGDWGNGDWRETDGQQSNPDDGQKR